MFCTKSVDLLDYKAVEFSRDDQEFATMSLGGSYGALPRVGDERRIMCVAGTPGMAEKGGDEPGTLSAEPWGRDYRIRYYLSSEKLKACN
jgi:hypothetical protein